MTDQYISREGLAHIHCCDYPIPNEVADKWKREVYEGPPVTISITMQTDSVEQVLAELKRRGFRIDSNSDSDSQED